MTSDPARRPESPAWWRRVPEPLWWAVLPVIGGFVVAWRDLVGDPVARWTGCPVVDWADLAFALAGLGLVLAAVVVQIRRTSERRCQPQLLLGMVVFLGGMSAYHLLTGLGRLGGVCG